MQKKSIFIAAAILVIVATAVCLWARAGSAERLTILLYHHIVADGEPVNDVTVTVSRFEADMRWLCDNGYTTVLPRELAAGEPLPEKPVMITFDDGYASNYHHAFPILQSLEMKAAIAVIGRAVNADAPFFLDWDMCREMSDSGLVEFGSHTYSLHNSDDRMGIYVKGTANGIERLKKESRAEFEARVLTDLQRSIDDLEAQLDTRVTYLAYPFGVREAWANDFIESHFALTLITRGKTANLSGGLYHLPRMAVNMDTPLEKYF